MSLNAGEALNLLLRRVGDPDGDRLGPAEGMLLIDQGVYAFNRETEILRTTGQTLTADATRSPALAWYTRPSDLYKVEALEYLGNPLEYRTTNQLRALYTDWRTTTGVPLYYNTDDETHILTAPYSATALTIYLDYIRNPQPTSTVNRIDLPNAYQLAPISWAAAEWVSQNSDRRESDMVRGWLAEFAMLADQAKGVAMTRGTKGPRRLGMRVR